MKRDQKHQFKELYNQLQNQYTYLCDGGTSYRIETSRLSLEVLKLEKDIEPFLSIVQTKKVVSTYFSNLEEERLQDVSKMLYLNASMIKRKNTMSNEMKQVIEDRKKNRKPLNFSKVRKEGYRK